MIRTLVDRIGVDPWDVDLAHVRRFVAHREQAPVSRYKIGSPCRLIRSLDVLVHVVLPEMLYERHPVWACYLRSTSPRWGRSWRSWE